MILHLIAEKRLNNFTFRTTDGDEGIQRIRRAETLHNSKQETERPFMSQAGVHAPNSIYKQEDDQNGDALKDSADQLSFSAKLQSHTKCLLCFASV